jgi:adenylate kinase
MRFQQTKNDKTLKIIMLNLILFGPPGSGKGTQAAKLVEKYNLMHISTGDLFRYEMGNNTPLGLKAKEYMDKGQLVPDEVTIGMLKNKVVASQGVSGFIFDGFPRTIPQSEALDALMTELGQSITTLIALDVDDEEIVARLLNRGKSSGRADDTDESIIRKRMSVYKQETTPVFDYYTGHGKAVKIAGMGSVEDIFTSLCDEIDRHL